MNFFSRLRALLFVSVLFALAIPAIADARSITWSGYTWQVRKSPGLEGPGPNLFNDSASSVWVDTKNKLHLRVSKDPVTGLWTSSEVFTDQWFGHGKYTWVVESQGDAQDPNIVNGMYNYLNDTHEFDVELGKWANPTNTTNAQYVVQPWLNPGNQVRFHAPAAVTTYSFDWHPTWTDFKGTAPKWAYSWTNSGPDITTGWGAPAHINLWQYGGRPPASGRTVEMVFRSFSFTPAP